MTKPEEVRELIERAAKRIHEAMVWAALQHGPPKAWVNGNSYAEDEARAAARDVLKATTLERASVTAKGGCDGMNWIYEKQAEAAQKVREELAKPIAEESLLQCDETFDPWTLFPAVYGTYSADFDWTMMEVLRALKLASEGDWDAAIAMQREEVLAHHIFREMLCNAELCDYGSSPRVCFATGSFKEVLPALIETWGQYSAMYWGASADTHPKDGDVQQALLVSGAVPERQTP